MSTPGIVMVLLKEYYNNTIAEEIVSLGGEMVPDSCEEAQAQLLWKEIAVKKINEAYEEYMKKIDCLTE